MCTLRWYSGYDRPDGLLDRVETPSNVYIDNTTNYRGLTEPLGNGHTEMSNPSSQPL